MKKQKQKKIKNNKLDLITAIKTDGSPREQVRAGNQGSSVCHTQISVHKKHPIINNRIWSYIQQVSAHMRANSRMYFICAIVLL